MLWVNFWVTFQAESELMMSNDLKRLDAAAEQSDVSECESSDDMEGSRRPAPLPWCVWGSKASYRLPGACVYQSPPGVADLPARDPEGVMWFYNIKGQLMALPHY